jgi:hypothetical protein
MVESMTLDWMSYLDGVGPHRQIRQTQFTSAGVHITRLFFSMYTHTVPSKS